MFEEDFIPEQPVPNKKRHERLLPGLVVAAMLFALLLFWLADKQLLLS